MIRFMVRLNYFRDCVEYAHSIRPYSMSTAVGRIYASKN